VSFLTVPTPDDIRQHPLGNSILRQQQQIKEVFLFRVIGRPWEALLTEGICKRRLPRLIPEVTIRPKPP
jgi:hypothetical protein